MVKTLSNKTRSTIVKFDEPVEKHSDFVNQRRLKHISFNPKAQVITFDSNTQPEIIQKNIDHDTVNFVAIEHELIPLIMSLSGTMSLIKGMNQIIPLSYLFGILYKCYQADNTVVIDDKLFCPIYIIFINAIGCILGVNIFGKKVTEYLSNTYNSTPTIGYSILLSVSIFFNLFSDCYNNRLWF